MQFPFDSIPCELCCLAPAHNQTPATSILALPHLPALLCKNKENARDPGLVPKGNSLMGKRKGWGYRKREREKLPLRRVASLTPVCKVIPLRCVGLT